MSMKSAQNARLGGAEKVLANRIFEHTTSQNRRTDFKSSSNRDNSAITKECAQNARLARCGESFAKIALLSTPNLKIVVLASNHRQIGITVRFLKNVLKTHVWDRAEQVLAKSHLSVH